MRPAFHAPKAEAPPEPLSGLANMGRAAEDLRSTLAIIEGEGKAMAEAHKRFAAKKPTQKRSAKSAE